MIGCLLIYALMGLLAWLAYEKYRRSLRLPAPESRVVLITGCDSGFGRLAARRLDGLGCRVWAACLTEQGAAELKEEVSDRLNTVIMNVMDSESIQRAYDLIKPQLPEEGLWGIVNNAGVGGAGGAIELLRPDDYMLPFRVNVVGMAEVNRIFLPVLKQCKGRIVNVTSMAGRIGFPDMGTYSASKFAAEAYSDVLRREMSLYGIDVSMIEPGLFRTGIINVDKYKLDKEQQWKETSEEIREQFGEDYLERDLRKTKALATKLASPDVHLVVEAYEHALLSVHPKKRYVVGRDAYVLTSLALLPEFVLDTIFLKRRKVLPKVLMDKQH